MTKHARLTAQARPDGTAGGQLRQRRVHAVRQQAHAARALLVGGALAEAQRAIRRQAHGCAWRAPASGHIRTQLQVIRQPALLAAEVLRRGGDNGAAYPAAKLEVRGMGAAGRDPPGKLLVLLQESIDPSCHESPPYKAAN